MIFRKYSVMLLGAIAVLAMLLVYFKNSLAQDNSFAQIIPLDGGQGAIRFFDTATGKLYTYDRTLQEVIRIVQIEELGKPAKVIYEPARKGESTYINPRKE